MTRQSRSESNSTGGRFPLDDLSYDLVTILHEKSKSLEAYDKYMRDAARDPEALKILEQIRRQDTQAIVQLKVCVARALGGQSGDATGDVGYFAGTEPTGRGSHSGGV